MTAGEIVGWVIGLITAFGGGGIIVALIDRRKQKDKLKADQEALELKAAIDQDNRDKDIQAAREAAASEQLKRMGEVALGMVEPLSKRVLILENERTTLLQRIDALENEVGCLQDSIASKDKEIIQLRDLITQRDNQIGKLQADVTDRDKQIANLRMRVEELEKAGLHG